MQTEFLRFFYGYRERGIVAARMAMACGRTDFARTIADSLEEGRRRSPVLSGQAFALQAGGLVDVDVNRLIEAVEMFAGPRCVSRFQTAATARPTHWPPHIETMKQSPC